jgi:hypothetical protein
VIASQCIHNEKLYFKFNINNNEVARDHNNDLSLNIGAFASNLIISE